MSRGAARMRSRLGDIRGSLVSPHIAEPVIGRAFARPVGSCGLLLAHRRRTSSSKRIARNRWKVAPRSCSRRCRCGHHAISAGQYGPQSPELAILVGDDLAADFFEKDAVAARAEAGSRRLRTPDVFEFGIRMAA